MKAQQVIETIQQSKIPEKVVAGGTVIAGTITMLDVVSGALPLIVTALGGVLTILLIYKTVINIKKDKIMLKHARKRRNTDKK